MASSSRGHAISDFVRLYIVLIAIPLVPHLLTWARDFNETARKMRKLDHANKFLSFWDNWFKAAETLIPQENIRDTGMEKLLHSVAMSAQEAVVEIGAEMINVYRAKEFREIREFKLDYAGFQAYRATLPWYRRAFLFYKSPNQRAKQSKVLFQAYLAVNFLVPFLGLIRDQLRGLLHRPALSDADWAVRSATFLALNVTIAVYFRQRSVMSENDPQGFIRDQMRRRYFKGREGPPD